ncbi:hypothetical protein [Celeribacter marinus]|uniref:Uncharacterized protein n=1 Tax=Celeribacter marinus TaxID=1397108 RepID=A0A0P0A4G0_9RHOB|nr:hypothetical protein [Celeribacter marinus]ALI55394.1 hypothetical protein IMCC12053_1447 [Celeribacter marinus]SFL06142.1 hypothetical protein SAMN05444421_1151 [Celeribacter marinus]
MAMAREANIGCSFQTLNGQVDWFDNHRLFGPIGGIPSAQAEQNLEAQRDVLNMPA